MKVEQQNWLDEHAVTCRVFKGKWSIRHCMRIFNEMKDLRIHMSSRAKGKVTRHESDYNPCRRCKVLAPYMKALCEEQQHCAHADEAGINRLCAV